MLGKYLSGSKTCFSERFFSLKAPAKPKTFIKIANARKKSKNCNFLVDNLVNRVYNNKSARQKTENCKTCVFWCKNCAWRFVLKKDILKLIDENYSSFSKGQKLISRYIKEHYDKAAYMTAAKLGGEVGVSESTVVRFVIELGFEGYPEFRRALLELVRSKLTAVQRIEVTNNLIGDADVLEKVLYSDIEKIKRTLDSIDKEAFDQAVRKIVDSNTVYIMGMRGSSYLAALLNYSFRMISDNVRLIQTTSGSETFEQMMSIGEDDALIAISFPRYSKSIIRGVEYAKSRGANVIALTDSINSPIAIQADQVLVAQSDLASFADSLVAPMSVINALIVAVSRECGERFTERLHRLETVWDEYNVYDKSHE